MEERYKMKILSIDDFKVLCNKLLFCEFIMCSENQLSSKDSGLLFDFGFTKMQIECNPNRIYLTNTQSSLLVFNRVKYVIEREESILGRVFDIVCKGFHDDTKEFKYRIIAR